MALYLGNDRVKITINNIKYKIKLYSEVPILNGAMLLSSDNYILKDSDGLYLTVDEEGTVKLVTSDNEILQDSNGLCLTIE